ncbi:putative membrane protein [Mycobacterium avium subsp. avium 2285 (R)]|nr:putative membrane protein [Mycobacterium avium MAV_061107_1842]ETZ58851.1 putative membrane protein [Mycobacterium sp. MAC_080597_8934]EUA37360.1 putative membrane protein [Mycobacterium avium subsp. avium 2285 (R)]
MVTASLIASAVSLSISVPLAWTPSSRRRGISLSLAGCSALVLVGGVLYAYLTMR